MRQSRYSSRSVLIVVTSRVMVILTGLLLLVLIWWGVYCLKEKPAVTKPVPPRILILMYHKINSDTSKGGLGLRVPAEKFEQQLKLLREAGYQSISPDELLDYLEGKGGMWPKAVLITFDDGYRDNFTVARPILLRQDFRATIFLVSDRIGQLNTWDVEMGGNANELLSLEEIRTMLAEGFWIGSHTETHPNLRKLAPSLLRQEIQGSKTTLEELFKVRVNYFCYPYGGYNRRIVEQVKASGFRAALTTAQGTVKMGDNRFTLKRIRVTGHYDTKQFLSAIGEQ